MGEGAIEIHDSVAGGMAVFGEFGSERGVVEEGRLPSSAAKIARFPVADGGNVWWG